jgi:hypothetical protein
MAFILILFPLSRDNVSLILEMDSAQGPRRSGRTKKQTNVGKEMTKALEAVAAKRAARAEKAASRMNNGPKRVSVKVKRKAPAPIQSQTRRVSRKKLPRGSLSAFLSRQRNRQTAHRHRITSLINNAEREAESHKANASAARSRPRASSANGASSRRRGPRPAIVRLTLAEYKHRKEIGELPARFEIRNSNGNIIHRPGNATSAKRYGLSGIREESNENENKNKNRTPPREGESR